jgi:hypothetical protein
MKGTGLLVPISHTHIAAIYPRARVEVTFDRIKIIVAFEVTSAEGEIRLNSENEAYGWFDEIPCNPVYNYAKYLPQKRVGSNKPDI